MENIEKKNVFLADASLLFVAILWGSGFIVIKNALEIMHPIYILILRFSLASIFLGLIFYKRLLKLKFEDLKAGFIIGLVLFIAFIAQTVGMQYTNVSNSAFITSSNVVMVPFVYWFISKKQPDIYGIIAAVMCFIGVGILSVEGNMKINIGDGLTLICAVFFALHIVFIGIYSKKHDPILLTILQFAFAAIFSLISGLIMGIEFTPIGGDMAVSVVYLVLAITILAFGIQNIAQKYTTSTHAAIILSLESVFGSLFAVWFLKEDLTIKLILGSIIILLAIVTAETKWNFLTIAKQWSSNSQAIDKQ